MLLQFLNVSIAWGRRRDRRDSEDSDNGEGEREAAEETGDDIGLLILNSLKAPLGKGQMGSALMGSLMGSLQISCFLTERLFWYSR